MEIINRTTEMDMSTLSFSLIAAIIAFFISVLCITMYHQFKLVVILGGIGFFIVGVIFLVGGLISTTEKVKVKGQTVLEKYEEIESSHKKDDVYAHLKLKNDKTIKVGMSKNEWINQKNDIHRGDTIKITPENKKQLERHYIFVKNDTYHLIEGGHLEKVNK